ncbi:putative L-ascorbate oxidase [Helianthus annuus]|uniref:L-ascorbate oxidase n=1 Tax=Helianthus annuus TaxID=4232 RepID=A0A9K3I812_HELAN|nr:L-ascorbate oxidase homolog [Helianthus annuus]KAF5791805.1 putative L-ascorbate oxidase [Helianthus annuus]KAJ0526818.1 putative L-ascorbate oxidase [Helianthus annuus]KAJ0535356.1 putative L-ascorbate oxidase [Helianthus annuus]KAJ0543213.1 putative L-ascorbate oxidase [Helianthus annuus]KAJ0708270.1 putative L-ascorbate oxidase [Helianthus annuus]
MKQQANFLPFYLGLLALVCVFCVHAEDPYRNFNWVVTYGQISPLGTPQRGILINGQFPGPTIECETNDNVIVNVVNKLDEPFLITWNGIKQRKTSWQDGVLGTNCPIPPGGQWTYHMQVKDQIGTFSYFASLGMHRAVGAFGGFNIQARPVIFVPYLKPVAEFNILVSDWWKSDHKTLRQRLDSGKALPKPAGLLINGSPRATSFTGRAGQRYLFRVSNVALTTSVNFRIQGHTLQLVEVEGAHTLHESYESIDLHVGQSASFLVTLHSPAKGYYIVASTRFTKPVLTATGILHYAGSTAKPSLPLPIAPTYQIHWSMKQARTIRWNLTANAARPNPQGAFHYGTIPITRTVVLANSKANIGGKLRYAVNKVSHVNPATPLKLADYFNIPGVFKLNSIKPTPPAGPAVLSPSVIGFTLHDFVEIVFQNNENSVQSWHLDGYDFWSVGFGGGQWNSTLRKKFYNLNDATTRYTVQVYPKSWSSILVSMDNKGMWNLRSANWARQYLGQQLYARVWNDEKSLFTEYDIPQNALRCGKAK